MKKAIVFMLCLAGSYSWAQVEEVKTEVKETAETLTENQKRIIKIPNRIEEAVAAKNYQEAANLKEELDLRKGIETAINNKNYQEAADLKNALATCECRPKPEKVCEDDVATQEVDVKKERSYGPKRFSFYLDFNPIGYGHASYERYDYYSSQGVYYDNDGNYTYPTTYHEPMPVRESVSNLLAGLRIGSSIFFGDLDKKFKVGLDISYLSVNAGINGDIMMPSFYASLARPGIIMTKFFNNKNGLDIKAHGGVMVGGGNYFGGFGVNGSAQVKYWKKRFAVGLEYQYGHLFENSTHINMVGVTLGLRL